jgi:hypothetical protein
MQIEMNVTYGQGFLPTLPMFANMGLAKIDVTPDKIVKLQDELLKMEQADIVTLHKFLPGIYERTIVIPPWTVLTGAEHRTAYKVRLDRGCRLPFNILPFLTTYFFDMCQHIKKNS